MPPNGSIPQCRYAALDGLRAVAIASVVVYHLNAAWLPAGYLGVDMFFVISGFLISSSVGGFSGRFHTFVAYFYSRRLTRIVPPLVVAICLTTIFTVLFVPFSWLSVANQNMANASHFGIANLELLKSWNDYFSPQAQYHSFTQMWSLAVEEQFYALFPLLFFPWLISRNYRRTVILGMLSITIVSLALALRNKGEVSNFFLLQSRMWELCFGVIVFQTSNTFDLDQRIAKHPHFFDTLSAIMVAGIFLSLRFLPSTQFPSAGAFIVAGGTALLISILRLKRGGWTQTGLSYPPIQAFGRISYSLYLFHWPIIVLFLWTTGTQSPVLKAVAATLSLVFASLSYLFVEKPIKLWQQRVELSPSVLVLGFGALLIASFAANNWLFQHQSEISLTTFRNQNYLEEIPNLKKATRKCGITTTTSPSGDLVAFTPIETCVSRHAKPKIFVLGDSHAMAYDPMLRELSSRFHLAVWRYGRGGCPFVDLRGLSSEKPKTCKDFFEQSRDEILSNANPGDFLFLPSLRLINLADQNGIIEHDFTGMMTPTMLLNRNRSILSAKAELARFLKRGLNVVFEAPTPTFLTPVFRCMDWFNRNNPVCEPGFEMNRSELISYRSPVLEGLNQVRTKTDPTSVFIWDPFPTLCPDTARNRCSALHAGRALFNDTHHLSAFGSLFLLTDFTDFLTTILRDKGKDTSEFGTE